MLKSACRLGSPLRGLSRALTRPQGTLASSFVEVQEVKKPEHWHVEKKSTGKVEKEPEQPVKEESQTTIGKYERFLVSKEESATRVHVNLADLSPHLQSVFAKSYIEELKQTVATKDLVSVSFNNITEDVYRYYLNMPIRKLGFFSHFQRYNDDRGLATFTRKDDSVQVVGFKATSKLQRKPRIVSDVEITI